MSGMWAIGAIKSDFKVKQDEEPKNKITEIIIKLLHQPYLSPIYWARWVEMGLTLTQI